MLVSVVALAAPAILAGLPAAHAATAEVVDHTALRVCADPHNLPFSNQAGEGFENKIAELLAGELHVPVKYTWYPDSMGFIRNTLGARRCDLVIGTSAGNGLLQNTNPYYHSAYSLVYRKDSGFAPTSLDDPALKSLRIGVIARTPPVTLMAQKGLLGHVQPYDLVVDTRYQSPAKDLVSDVAAKKVDVGILWGPIAGYFAKQGGGLTVVPLRSAPGGERLDYRITMGVRNDEPDWKHEINQLIRKKQPEIDRILADYGVPLLDEQGAIIRP